MSELKEPVAHPSEVQFYSAHAQELSHSQKHKIQKFLEYNCIEYVGNGEYICKPILGYNRTIYHLKKGNIMSEFECNCQGFTQKKKRNLVGFCSHIGALYKFFAQGQKYE